MEVGLLFKIGAVGILVSVLCQILKHSQRGAGIFDKPDRTSFGIVLDTSLYLRFIPYH